AIARPLRDWDVGDTVDCLALDSVGVRSRKHLGTVNSGCDRQDVQCVRSWPINTGQASGRRISPLDHQLVGQLQERLRPRSGPADVESLWNAMRREIAGISGIGYLQVTLCQLVGI